MPLVSFYTPCKHQKTSRAEDQWHEIVEIVKHFYKKFARNHSSQKKNNLIHWPLKQMFRDRLQLLLLLLRESAESNWLLFPQNFRRNKSKLICLNSLNIRSEIWRRSLTGVLQNSHSNKFLLIWNFSWELLQSFSEDLFFKTPQQLLLGLGQGITYEIFYRNVVWN